MIADDTGRRIDQEREIRSKSQTESIMTSIETVVRKLEWAKRENRALQEKAAPGSVEWQRHDTIDERLHEAMTALGQ